MFLKTASLLYGFLLTLRHAAYDRGFLSIDKGSIPVVSVGNLALGGTGKTPIAQLLALELSSRRRVAMILRGYKGRGEHKRSTTCISKGEGPLVDVAIAGDEAYLHAKKLACVSVWVGKRRIKSLQASIGWGAEIAILDDGMQHRALQRDIELVVLDGREDFREEKLVPLGRLRDIPKRLSKADGIFIHHPERPLSVYKNQLAAYTKAPLIGTEMIFTQESIKQIQGKKVAYYCALGRPEKFIEILKTQAQEVVYGISLRDHSVFSEKKLRNFSKIALQKGAESIVCTEKDFVKLPKGLTLDLPIVELKAHVQVVSGKKNWKSLVESILLKSRES